MTAPSNTNAQYPESFCQCGQRGLHACGLWMNPQPIQPIVRPPYYTSGFISTTDPRIAKLEDRVAELESIIARAGLTKRRPRPSKDAG